MFKEGFGNEPLPMPLILLLSHRANIVTDLKTRIQTTSADIIQYTFPECNTFPTFVTWLVFKKIFKFFFTQKDVGFESFNSIFSAILQFFDVIRLEFRKGLLSQIYPVSARTTALGETFMIFLS